MARFGFVPVELRRREPWLTLLAFVALFVAFSTQIQAVVQNGDAAVYNEQVETHSFGVRTIHTGYMLLGSVFHALLPVQIDRAMNLMALFFGVLGAASCYATAKLWGSRLAGIASVLLLLCSSVYVRGMLLSEVDILSASLVSVAFALHVRKHAAWAGAVFGLAMLSTPITATLLPLFVFTFALDPGGIRGTVRTQFRRVLAFGIAALVVYLPFVIWHRDDYLYGGRGLIHAPRDPFDASLQLLRGAHFFADEIWAFGAFAVLGSLSALADRKQWRLDQPVIGLVLSVLASALIADRAGDVPAQLGNLPVLAVLAAVGFERVARLSRHLVWLLPIGAAVMMLSDAIHSARNEIERQRALHDTYRGLLAQSAPLPVMLVDPGGFTPRILFEHYTYGRSYTEFAPTLRELRGRLRSLRTEPASYTIAFRRSVPRDVARALEGRYVEQSRTVNGKRFRVLVPAT